MGDVLDAQNKSSALKVWQGSGIWQGIFKIGNGFDSFLYDLYDGGLGAPNGLTESSDEWLV